MKQKHLLSLLFMLAALLSGCSSSDDILSESSPGSVDSYTASVLATKGDVDDLDELDGETRAVFYGGNSRRYVTLWDQGDVVHVYKGGAEVGTMTPSTYGTLTANLNGTLTGPFAVDDELKLYLPSLARDYSSQKGTINDLSQNLCYQVGTVTVTEASDQILTLTDANLAHKQAYLRLVLTDEAGNRLHPSKVIISANPVDGYPGRIVQSIDAEGNITYGPIEITPDKEDGEYPGELFVALLNETNANNNYVLVNFSFTAIVDGETYVGPTDKAFRSTTANKPAIGGLTKVLRVMSKLSSSTTTTATLGDMDGQQGFDNSNKGATLGDMEGQEDL